MLALGLSQFLPTYLESDRFGPTAEQSAQRQNSRSPLIAVARYLARAHPAAACPLSVGSAADHPISQSHVICRAGMSRRHRWGPVTSSPRGWQGSCGWRALPLARLAAGERLGF